MTTMNPEWAGSNARDVAQEASESWWLFVVTGVVWFVFAAVVLSFTYNTVWAIAIFFGVSLLMVGVTEFAIMALSPRHKVIHALLAVAAIAAGILALAWPNETFNVAATLIGWYLLARGVIDFVGALMTKEYNDLWWLQLIAGIGEAALGFWAIGYPGRSTVLLAVWVGAAALLKGITDTATGFELRSLGKRTS